MNREREQMLFDAIAFLERENEALRAELERQWQENHDEHCSNVRVCGPTDHCSWPRPALIETKEQA